MNRISVFGRFLHVVAAGVFVLAANGEAFGLHRPCPHHEGGHAVAAASTGEASGHAEGHAHDGAGPEAGDDAGHGPCSCLGSCVAGAAQAALTADNVETVLRLPEAAPRLVRELEAPAPAGVREHRLPFPNGPPLG